MRETWIQKQILNDRPHPRCKPTEGEVQRIYYPALHRIRRLRESLRLSANASRTDLASRIRVRRCIHRALEGNLHQQFDDSTSTQRKQQAQHHERSTAGRYHIAQAVYSSTRKHIPTTDLRNERLEDKRRIS